MKRLLFIIFFLAGAFAMDVKAQPVNETPADLPYEEHLIQNRRIIPYDHIRQADVFWRKRLWRVIDTREKINLPFIYPKRPFMEVVMDALKEGQLTVYNSLDDEFKQPLPYAELMQTLVTVDTSYTISPFTFNDTMIIAVDSFNPLNVTKFRLKEDWIFDEETSTMIVRIRGIAPVEEVYDQNTGEFKGERYMFWIHYPSARDVFSHHEAFNPYNDAIRMSWEDVFEMRLFSSYIVKESNVYDREIQSYTSGIDAVLESERLKEELFEKEHELWTY